MHAPGGEGRAGLAGRRAAFGHRSTGRQLGAVNPRPTSLLVWRWACQQASHSGGGTLDAKAGRDSAALKLWNKCVREGARTGPDSGIRMEMPKCTGCGSAMSSGGGRWGAGLGPHTLAHTTKDGSWANGGRCPGPSACGASMYICPPRLPRAACMLHETRSALKPLIHACAASRRHTYTDRGHIEKPTLLLPPPLPPGAHPRTTNALIK